ncbi:MAG: hypothetical protein HY904_26260 [Deltaproteobacteria bacterium]|nr:hypothetical protein [Deltaproteobacteria bacterium]
MKNTIAGLVVTSWMETCAFSLHPASTPPPTKTADLDATQRTITVSSGVAFAVQCVESNGAAECRGLHVESDDPGIAEVRPGYLAPVVQAGGVETGGATVARRSVFVVIGHASGETALRIVTEDGHDRYLARVVSP